jgi:CBS domain-containing protein
MKTKVQEVMTTDVLVANESTPFKEIAELLARQRISAVPVLDAAGQLVGGGVRGRPAAEGGAPRRGDGRALVRAPPPPVERGKAAAAVARELMTSPPSPLGRSPTSTRPPG